MFALATSFAEASQRGMAAALLFALSFGFLTALTPCVYPMIPITIAIFGAKKGVSRRRAIALATCYVAGMAVLYGTLGTIVALAGKQYGQHLADPRIVVPLALIFVAMAVSMFGAFELNLPPALQERLSRVGGGGPGGAFLMGLVAGLIAAPCTGPPLAGILAWVSTTRDAVRGFTLLATYAVGIGIPFWALAGLSMALPRPGAWMEAVKSVFGMVMLGAAYYFLRPIIPALDHVSSWRREYVLVAVAAIVFGVALGAVHLSFHDRGARLARKTLGTVLGTLGLFMLTNWVLTAKPTTLVWFDSEPPAMAEATRTSRKLLVDFRAEWCLPCKELEAQVFSNPKVAADQLDEKFILLKVDLTHEDDNPALGQLKLKYGVDTLPAVRVATAAGGTLSSLNQVTGPDEFLATFLRAPATAVP